MSEHPREPISYFLAEAERLEKLADQQESQYKEQLAYFNSEWDDHKQRAVNNREKAQTFRKFAYELDGVFNKAWRYDEASK